jgi:PHD/YefM family antitoxin component YafN of YafNO toxin-antitoxin module
MQVFTSEELQRRPADVQQSALVEPTFITLEGRPRLVMMSVDAFERLRNPPYPVLDAVTLSEDILAEIASIAAEHPADSNETALLGGLLNMAGTIESA